MIPIMIATCIPLNARIWATPELLKESLTSLERNDLSPRRIEIINSDTALSNIDFSIRISIRSLILDARLAILLEQPFNCMLSASVSERYNNPRRFSLSEYPFDLKF